MLKKILLITLFIICHFKINAQNYQYIADSLYTNEEYEKSITFRNKHLTSLQKNTPTFFIEEAKWKLTKFYIQKKQTTKTDTTIINEVLQSIKKIPKSQAANEVLIEATVALSNFFYNYDNPAKALQILETVKNLSPLSLNSKVLLNYTFASIYDNYDSTYKKSVHYFLQGIEAARNPSYTNKNSLALLYNDVGLVYEWLGQMDKNIAYYKLAHNIWWKNYKAVYINNNISCLGNLITAAEDYGLVNETKTYLDSLLNYFEWVKKQTLNKKLEGRTTIENIKSEYYVLLMAIRAYNGLNNETLMLISLEKITNLFNQSNAEIKKEFSANLFEAYETVALHYRLKNEITKAIEYFNKTAKYVTNDFYKMKSAANMGVTYTSIKETNKALPYLNNAIEIVQKTRPNSTTYLGLLATKAEALHNEKKYFDALKVLDTLFATNIDSSFNNKNILQLNIVKFKNKINHTQIKVLVKCGKVYLGKYKTHQKNEDLQKANHFYTLAAQLFKMYYNLEFYSSYMNELNNEINYGLLLSTQLSNNAKIDKVLDLIENNNTQNIWKKFQLKYSSSINIPDSLIEKRNNFIKQLDNFYLEDNKAKEAAETQKKLQEVENKINAINTAYLNFCNTTFSVSNLQKKLRAVDLIVRYFITDSMLFAATITNKKIALYPLSNTTIVNNLITKLKTEISSISNNYTTTSNHLYQLFIAKLAIEESYKNIIIIPEGSINFLPFEMLYNATNKQFLVTQKNISYAYSLPLWQTQTIANSANKKVVAFAPNYNLPNNTQALVTRSNNYDLVNARTEATTITNIYNGKLFENNFASVDNFINSTGKYGIYHLAMHASMNNELPDQSHLTFANNQKVFFNQLYELNIPSSMMVLSACNTGIGALQQGEGVQSLSRAATYSGVQSTVFSLWEVPDKETSEIMIAFYKNLAKGQSKVEALANAKKTFLQKNPAKQHPFYWAGFVLNGNTAPIKNSNNWFWVLLPIAVLAGFAGFKFIKRNKAATI
jgi:CHAT domain-containing protein/tetratricopeptide (TPR) repeat protein